MQLLVYAFSIISVGYFTALRNGYMHYVMTTALYYYTVLLRPSFDRLHNLLLLTQQVVVCVLLLPNSCATAQLIIWNAACHGLVSAEAQS